MFMFEMREPQTYKLRPINDCLDFCFPSDVVHTVSDAELAVARVDESQAFFRHKHALRRSLTISEAICSMRIAGNKVSHRDLLSEGFKQSLLEEKVDPSILDRYASFTADTKVVKETLSLANMIHHIHKTISENETITTDFFITVQECLAQEAGVSQRGLRSHPVAPIPFGDGYYYPPTPEEIRPILDHIIDFCSSGFGSSTITSAIAHFYLELVIPFDWGNDRMGRLLAHMIYSKQKMWKYLVLPIGALPAMATKQHALSLLPYMTEQTIQPENVQPLLNDWIVYCGQAMRVGAHFGNIYSQRIRAISDRWINQLGEIRKDSAALRILDELPTAPVFSISYMSQLTGKSFTSINEAVTTLIEAGIVNQISFGRRNRIFEATDILDFYAWIEKQILPRNINAREAYLIVTR